MRKKTRTIITMAIIIASFIFNINFVSAAQQGGGALGHGPTANGDNGGPLLGPGPGMSLGNDQSILNKNLENAIAPIEDSDGNGSILHVGTHRIFGIGNGDIEGIVGSEEQIDNYNIALTKVLTVIQNVVNYTLGLLSVIAVIYILIHGFMILTAAGDDSKTKKGLKGIKNAFIAIAGIALSWIIISLILWLINTFSS